MNVYIWNRIKVSKLIIYDYRLPLSLSRCQRLPSTHTSTPKTRRVWLGLLRVIAQQFDAVYAAFGNRKRGENCVSGCLCVFVCGWVVRHILTLRSPCSSSTSSQSNGTCKCIVYTIRWTKLLLLRLVGIVALWLQLHASNCKVCAIVFSIVGSRVHKRRSLCRKCIAIESG